MINSLSLRSNYKTLKKFTYLNQASLGLISEKTATSMIEFLNKIAKHGNAHMSDQDEVNFFHFVLLHRSLQYLTSSQFFSHFFRHLKGRLHTKHIFSGRASFFLFVFFKLGYLFHLIFAPSSCSFVPNIIA